MDHEFRLLHSRASGVDLVDCDLERSGHILVGRFIEADMTVADLDERKVLDCIFFAEFVVAANTVEAGTPATIDHTNPVPAHAMHSRKLRRSMTSAASTFAPLVCCALC